MGAADQGLLAAHGCRSFVFAMFLLKEQIPFPAPRLRLGAAPLLCSHVPSSIPPDRLCQMGLSLPLVCHTVLKFIKIKFEGFLMPKI